MEHQYFSPLLPKDPGVKPKIVRDIVLVLLTIVIASVISVIVWGRAPAGFIPQTVVTISPGTTVAQAGDILEQDDIIRSSLLFRFLVKTLFQDRPIIAGNFQFNYPENILEVLARMTGGLFGKTQVTVTIPEGSSVAQIAQIVGKAIPGWDEQTFITEAKPFEGYLFPETYRVFKTITPDQFLALLKEEYEIKIEPLRPQILASGKTESQIIIMASILEKEAENGTDAKVISGILWKRISMGIPLQVDAPFYYLLEGTNIPVTPKVIETDGPYNTYTRKGLPVGPIGNPGLVMIEAAIHPTSSQYLYYLHDKKGNVHYAVTFAQHEANIKKYLQ